MNIVDIEKNNRENFRSLLDCLSMPGSTNKIEKLFDSYVLSIASVLLYSEVSYANSSKNDFTLIDTITNAKKEDIKNADYIFCEDVNEVLLLAKKGTFLNPDFSATIICIVDSFEGTLLKLKGPGINIQKEEYYPVNKEFINQFNNKSFPLGNEIFFINKNNGMLRALSRTTKLELM
ncbi:phosphonate C-P lyase system protein PhnH [Aliarcobacter cibarius]|uniref:Phosphonate C-P lyase system protein PhnH n=1 Tax=Aliarcobacter cibarius TaxID=255507 RepID=A0ABY2V8M3_9BACT|nr:phosphonate C-P lyase system protein PhnH [Aliarcobacter cibarius]TLS97590.1 phosphonate C-P lyase system protein PhnH [Aliarcobacter cibarius]TLS98105.1 phosphonate C-P lyase system protein PhnH [Aliarcobacter cibarius]